MEQFYICFFFNIWGLVGLISAISLTLTLVCFNMFQVYALQCDVRDPSSIKDAVDHLVSDVGLPDVG